MSKAKKIFKKIFFDKVALKVILAIILTAFVALAVFLKKTEVLPQASIYFLNEIKLPQSGDRVLIISPHPDDETIATGGIAASSIKNKADVKVILITDGNKHGKKDERYAEFRKSTGILGVSEDNLIFLNFPDGELKNTDRNSLRDKIDEQINAYHPSYLFYPDPNDSHPDHAISGEIVEQIINGKYLNHLSRFRYLVHHHHFPQPRKLLVNSYMLPPANMVHFDNEWQKFILSKDIEKNKEDAVFSYTSQLRVPVLRSLILSFIRKNELFSVGQ